MYTFTKGPLYDKMKKEFAPSEEYFDKFVHLLLESLHDAGGFALTPTGGKILITPRLTREFNLNEREIREMECAMNDFYQGQGMADVIYIAAVPSIHSKRGRKPKKSYPRTNTELFGVSYASQASFSGWLLEHADEKYKKYFSQLLHDFSQVQKQHDALFPP